jgi:hypothetical protein
VLTFYLLVYSMLFFSFICISHYLVPFNFLLIYNQLKSFKGIIQNFITLPKLHSPKLSNHIKSIITTPHISHFNSHTRPPHTRVLKPTSINGQDINNSQKPKTKLPKNTDSISPHQILKVHLQLS